MLIYILSSNGLRQLPCGRPINVERILCKSKGDEKRYMWLKRENNVLQNFGACKESRCDIRVDVDGVKGAMNIYECSKKNLFVVKGMINMTYER